MNHSQTLLHGCGHDPHGHGDDRRPAQGGRPPLMAGPAREPRRSPSARISPAPARHGVAARLRSSSRDRVPRAVPAPPRDRRRVPRSPRRSPGRLCPPSTRPLAGSATAGPPVRAGRPVPLSARSAAVQPPALACRCRGASRLRSLPRSGPATSVCAWAWAGGAEVCAGLGLGLSRATLAEETFDDHHVTSVTE